MTISASEAEQLASEWVQLELQSKETNARIKEIKALLLEYASLENINDYTWSADNGHVVLSTMVKYSLVDIPSDVSIDPNVVAIDLAEKAFTSKIFLSKEGKQMLKEGYPSLIPLVVPKEKKVLKCMI